ncbi:U32 family peptidase C-terminal domain-containing protein, partial [Halomonas sp.]
YFNHRDPNQGTCTNACRWKYNTVAAAHDETGDLVPANSARAHAGSGIWTPGEGGQQGGGLIASGGGSAEVVESASASTATAGGVEGQDELSALIEDRTRPGELMPVFEDEHGTYIMNSKDLRAVQHVPQLAEMGVTSLKIEGRTKSHYYVARTAQVYRRAIDDAVAGRPFDMRLMDELDNLANRGYTEGFYRRHVHDEYQNYEQGNSVGVHQQFVGEVIGYDPDRGSLEVDVKNRFEVGDGMELMLPGGNRRFVLEHIENKRGESVGAAPGSGHVVRIPVPGEAIAPERIEFALLMRDLK